MTDPDLAEALTRAHAATRRTHHVTTDGRQHYPDHELELLAAFLGYALGTYQPGQPGGFVTDERSAQWRIAYTKSIALHVLKRAGADPADVATIAAALGVEERDSDLLDAIDARNEQAREFWVGEFQRLQAVAVANARDAGRAEAAAPEVVR